MNQMSVLLALIGFVNVAVVLRLQGEVGVSLLIHITSLLKESVNGSLTSNYYQLRSLKVYAQVSFKVYESMTLYYQ